MVHIEIDGKELEVRQGQMIIEAADEIGIQIPRFCYHKKLSIAANCRMCLVEVANAPKPLPACATPVSEGMKIYTTTVRALDAQKAVMEFLLINHPLDCPICDQGGQCELQDVAMSYGKDCSQFTERKRVVKDKNIGPLISTDMTRCIHCTRCVRFGAEIAGARELGATGRGEFMQIGTYVEKSVNSELSGNVIDLCPVGALTSKPFRFQARAWELQATPSISPHDCVGSHLFFHRQNDQVLRTLPRENEALNEVWLSDRDRFSYEGFNHPERLKTPMIKLDGTWKSVDWHTGLSFAVEKLHKIVEQSSPSQIGAIASPNCTIEEFYLLQKLFRSQGCHNIDHRLRQMDNTHQSFLPSHPSLGVSLNQLEQQSAILLIGSDIRKEQPIISHRLRKATVHGGKVYAINPCEVNFNFTITQKLIGEQGDLIQPLMETVKAVLMRADKAKLESLPAGVEQIFHEVVATDSAINLAEAMINAEQNSILLGAYAWSHPQAHKIYWLSRLLAHLTNATWGEMSNGANSAGGWLAGAVPHRGVMGQKLDGLGLSTMEMWEEPRQGYLLLNCEPEYDCATPGLASKALKQADAVVVLTAFENPHIRDYADVMLPITPISEMAGTYVNALGDWQSFQPAVTPLAESRPAWKVLRVLGNLWKAPDFAYENITEVLSEIQNLPNKLNDNKDSLLSMSCSFVKGKKAAGLIRLAPTPLYAVDGVTRRAAALQETQDAKSAVVKIHSLEAKQRGLHSGQNVWVLQKDAQSTQPLPICIDDGIPLGTAWIPAGIEETAPLGAPFSMIELKPQ